LRLSLTNSVFAILSAAAILTALWRLHAEYAGVQFVEMNIDGAPATIYRPASAPLGPVVLIAHGFAGSGRLMQSFALTFARNGYIAATFDFPGHGRNPKPLTGNLTEVDGATKTLVSETAKVAATVRGLGDGRLAVLGHSMASDIVVRFAESDPEVAATIAVSMFSPAVTATSPRNLLVIVGDWEGFLKSEALRAIGLATSPDTPEPSVTYGEISRGTGRRVSFSPHVEHASVLFGQSSMREAVDWLDLTFGIMRKAPPQLDARGPWILLLLAGVVGFARPLFTFLPTVSVPPVGAGLSWSRLWAPLVIPMIATPLLLRVLPTHFLPVLVADYLSVHFVVYGLTAAICVIALRRHAGAAAPGRISYLALAGAALAVTAYGFVALVWPIDSFVTSFVPGPERLILTAAMLVGTLIYFLSDEWAMRGLGAGRGAYAASKLAFLLSLSLAIALDFERLFFLILIVPIIAVFFIVHGLFSGWAYRRAGHPFAGGIANAIAFAWALGVTFPLVAG
jgi:pimeloyl-ACP methyl ester carboxylesterase